MTEKYKLQQEDINSMDLNRETLAKLKQILPEVFAEGVEGKPSIDIERLKIALGGAVDVESDNKSRFSFGWSGKKQAQALANQPSTATLRPSIDDSKMWDSTQNVYIEGDNLEVLKLLQKSYYGQIKMIYIDPPYNTGKDFVYKDNFHDNVKNYLQLTGQVDDEGNRISTNTDKSGRYHTDWLNMMYPRLKLARNLLKDDGVIFISIDDNEVHNLRKICDEIFGEDNFIGTVIWKNATDNNPTQIAVEHEYIIIFAKNTASLSSEWKSKVSDVKELLLNISQKLSTKHATKNELINAYNVWYKEHKNELWPLDRYKYIDFDGVYTGSQSVHNPGREGYRYDVIHPITKKPCKQPLMGYRFPKVTLDSLINEGKILFGEDETKIIELKLYASEYSEKLNSVIEYDGRIGSYDLKNLFEESKRIFTNPKAVKFLSLFFDFILEKNDMILDFFSGSATTAHAVMQLNAEDGGRRKYICVQLPEATTTDIEAHKAGYKNICEIGKERIRRAGEKVLAEWTEKQQKSAQASADAGLFTDDTENNTAQTSLDIGFKVFKLDTSNLKPFDSVDMFADDLLVADRSALDLFYELVLKQGYSLDNHQCVLDIGGTRCYALVHEDNTPFVLAVLDDTVKPNFALELLKYALTLVIVKDACFGTDEIKLNLLATLEQLQSKDNPLQIRII